MVLSTGLAVLGAAAGIAGALGFYLASPNQRLIAQRMPLRAGLLVGSIGLLASLVALLQVSGPATSVYLLLTLVMSVWSVVPLVLGWWRHHRSGKS